MNKSLLIGLAAGAAAAVAIGAIASRGDFSLGTRVFVRYVVTETAAEVDTDAIEEAAERAAEDLEAFLEVFLNHAVHLLRECECNGTLSIVKRLAYK